MGLSPEAGYHRETLAVDSISATWPRTEPSNSSNLEGSEPERWKCPLGLLRWPEPFGPPFSFQKRESVRRLKEVLTFWMGKPMDGDPGHGIGDINGRTGNPSRARAVASGNGLVCR